MENNEKQYSELLQIRRDKLKELQENGRDPFEITKYNVTAKAQDIKDNYSDYEGKKVSVAGRLMSKRGMGKVGFCHMADITGQIQLFVKKDILGEDEYAIFKKYDIGDLVGAEGEVFTTQTGEVSIRVEKIVLLAKSLLPSPRSSTGLLTLI